MNLFERQLTGLAAILNIPKTEFMFVTSKPCKSIDARPLVLQVYYKERRKEHKNLPTPLKLS